MATVTEASVTIIGESVQVRGNLSGDEDLHVLGRVEGSLQLERTLVVAESGVVKAEVSVRNAIVSGVVVGNIHASESVEITRQGRMVGDIAAPRVIIVDGASFRGNVDMGDIENMPARPPRRERPEPTPIPREAKGKSAPAKADKREEKKAPAADERTVVEDKAPPSERAEPTKETARPEDATARTVVTRPPTTPPGKKPGFLNPPKAKGLPPKKQKSSRVVVKRR